MLVLSRGKVPRQRTHWHIFCPGCHSKLAVTQEDAHSIRDCNEQDKLYMFKCCVCYSFIRLLTDKFGRERTKS